MEKPLPDIPASTLHSNQQQHASSTLSTLTVEAYDHLHKFLLCLLEDEEGLESSRDEWVRAIQGGLRELGEGMAMGDWLAGIKRGKLLKKKLSRTAEVGSTVKSGISEEAKGDVDEHQPASKVSTGSTPKSIEDLRNHHLESLRSMVNKSTTPLPKPRVKHLLLTVTPFGVDWPENAGLKSIETSCRFVSGAFALPPQGASGNDLDNVVYGLDEWNDALKDEDALQIVGGTFVLNGPASSVQHSTLRKILRVSLFAYLSVLLEQQVLSDSHVPLRFRKPSLPLNGSPSAPAGAPVHRALSTSHVGYRPKRDSHSGFWSFLSKKKDDFVRRAADAAPMLVRRGSLDLPATNSSPQPRSSEENSARPRRLSIIGDFRPSFLGVQKEQPPEEPPFATALSLLKRFEDLYSTSPGVAFSPPPLLVRLAEKEKRDPERKLTGDERAALSSILGWTTKAAKGNGMAGTSGFVLQQGLCVLYSENTPAISPGTSRPTTPGTTRTHSSSSVVSLHGTQKTSCCGLKKWVTYRYWSRDVAADECLGDAVIRMCGTACDPCQEPKCQWKRGEHERLWTHAGVRVSANLSFDPGSKLDDGSDAPVEMWESCVECGKEGKKQTMSDGTYLFSFAKYLELLIYSPTLLQLAVPPCEHTTTPSRPWSHADTPLPKMRTNIVRNFSYSDRRLSFTISTVEDIFEVSVPRLQIIRGRLENNNEQSHQSNVIEPDRRALRREMMKWWQGLAEYIDELEANFVPEHATSFHKSLPRLPSVSIDDGYDLLDDDDGVATPKGRSTVLPPHPPNTPQTPRVPSRGSLSFPFPSKQDEAEQPSEPTSTPTNTPHSSTITTHTTSELDSLQLLTSIRHSFQRTEQNLYTELARTPESSLNDARRSFHTAAKGATRRLNAWQTKHTPSMAGHLHIPSDVEPSWWSPGCHAMPGSNVLIRENDWGSIIAFTLSSQDYARELTNMSSNRSHIMPPVPPPTPAKTRPSFFSRGKWSTSPTQQPDPDQEDAVWHEPEEYSAVISRKEHPRDPTSILMTIPEVLRKAPVDLSSLPSTSKFASFGTASGKAVMPPLARAKAEVQVSRQAADAYLSGVSSESVDKIISGLEAVSDIPRSRRNSGSDSQTSASTFFETNIRRGKTSSIMTRDSDTSTIGPPSTDSHLIVPPPLPPKHEASEPTSPEEIAPPTESTISATGSMSETLTNTLGAALRYMVGGGESPHLHLKHHHGLLSTASPAIDERPHIKYDWTIGKRLRFSCTVYYAKQFDSLRRRCGIEDTFLKSLARSENWLAEGGKSKSNFWRTTDNQYIIKTLVNAWNVADLQVLIDLGPSYFRYMDATASKATVLAKLLGFYTVEIKNLETGTVQAKADLLVMENLFYNQTIAKTFDLKGIQGRRVKASSGTENVGSKTLFDGEWIEGQQRALTLVHPHSKAILTEAIRSDCEFLARSNIMDYSLLVGICQERKHIYCGLVDAIGSYTFAKTLEYKAKQGLSTGKEVTVIPPVEYQDRFVNAMDNYFLACPDKWSRPLDHTSVPSDYRKLPSVL
ncbi:hypothetical protein BXZ70DRAFT_919923 [Cristinia sonorae]|uniref:PIPK domain-containing protein n=1 Tax=Cristinia sonorae TaxID=1940300 RepID=A0A8K0UWH8_9AGAR|nr:hypothetical protein BXZ70DRAFT_919923 [Cristinia sonorae]